MTVKEEYIKMSPFGSNSVYQPVEEPAPPEDQLRRKKTLRDRFHHPLTFTFITALSLVMSSAPGGYQGGIISSLEKRFQLSSTQAAFLSTFYDVMALSTVLFVTHFGQSRHRPRVIGCIQMCTGLALLINTIPHFLYPAPSFIVHPTVDNRTENHDYMCHADGYDDNTEMVNGKESGALMNEFAWMYLATFLASFSSPVVALALPYIDDSVNKQSTSVYAGVLIASYSIGSVLGFFLAAGCLSVPAYPLLVGQPGYPTDASDPNWLGAWWLGYLIVGIFMLFWAPLFFFFPRKLPDVSSDRQKIEDQPVETSVQNDCNDDTAVTVTGMNKNIEKVTTGVKEFLYTLLKSVIRICTNIPVMTLFIVGFLHLASFAGAQLFGAQYMQFQFGLQAQVTSLLLGLFSIPSGIVGTMVGGYCIKRFGNTRVKMAWLLVGFTVLAFCFDPIFVILGCPTPQVAGVNEPYDSGPHQPPFDVNTTCNAGCGCELNSYHPVCGEDGLTYVTPCFAGCTVNVTEGSQTNYSDCSCISNSTHSYDDGGTARSGECRPFCQVQLIIYFAVGLLWSSCMTLMAIPGLMLTLRCVSDEDRSLTVTIGNVISKIFGQIPAPIVFGALIDGCCILHQTISGKEGNCLLYNNEALRWSMNGLITALHFLSLILTVFAAFVIWFQDRGKNLEVQESDDHRPLTTAVDGEDDGMHGSSEITA